MAVAVLNPTQLLKPRAERVIAAIDVGSSKVAALVAMADGQDQPRVIGAWWPTWQRRKRPSAPP